MFQRAMARTDSSSLGSSKKPRPLVHWYSLPDRFTPRSITCCPSESSMVLATTRKPLLVLTGTLLLGSNASGQAPLSAPPSPPPPSLDTGSAGPASHSLQPTHASSGRV